MNKIITLLNAQLTKHTSLLILFFAVASSAWAQTVIYSSASQLELYESTDDGIVALAPPGETSVTMDRRLPGSYIFTVESAGNIIISDLLTKPQFRDSRTIIFKVDSEDGSEVWFDRSQIYLFDDSLSSIRISTFNEQAFNSLSDAIIAAGVTPPEPPDDLYGYPLHLDLVVKSADNGIRYADVDTWRNCRDKSRYSILGIMLIADGESFMLDWTDRYDEIGGYIDWYSAIERYGNRLPTLAQARVIKNCERLREVAAAYGSDNYGNYYWTRTECDAPDNDCAFIFCPGVPDAAYDRSKKAEPSNNGILLVTTQLPDR